MPMIALCGGQGEKYRTVVKQDVDDLIQVVYAVVNVTRTVDIGR